jgi:hypothetical protein
MSSYLKSVFENFNVSGTWLTAGPTGSGHIHSTYLVRTVEESAPDYILQKINDNVFPPVQEMMNNIEKVVNHIKKNKPSIHSSRVLEIIRTKGHKNFFTDHAGTHWRMYRNIFPGVSYDIVPNEKVAREAGKAFGNFIADLRDLPASRIFPVIPEFHSMEMRFKQFNRALQDNPVNRAEEVKAEIDFVRLHIDSMLVIPKLEKEGRLPIRVTHNDTKLNNVLFDNDDNAVCVIDLDTVMPGLSLYDFGDTIRTAANTGEEDEADPDRIQFNQGIFKSYAEGFLAETIHFLDPVEIEYLAFSSQYMTFIMGLRFLTDYIAGDVYYSIHYPEQNLRRCRAQFRLMQCMIDNYRESREIVAELAKTQRERMAGNR